MGQTALKICKVNHDELLIALNEAFAEEWLAYYQYWIGAKVAAGPMREEITEDFEKHAKEELAHAELIADRIIQLGGTPILYPNEWEKHAKCKYDAPTDEYVMTLVVQNLDAERCAIARYQQICEMTFGKDYETFRIASHILNEELEHEQDMEDYIKDVEMVKKHL